MVHIIAIFLLFGVLTVMNISEMHAKLVVSYYRFIYDSSPIVELVSRYHVIQVKSDNGKGVYSHTRNIESSINLIKHMSTNPSSSSHIPIGLNSLSSVFENKI